MAFGALQCSCNKLDGWSSICCHVVLDSVIWRFNRQFQINAQTQVMELLSQGANPMIKGDYGETVLHFPWFWAGPVDEALKPLEVCWGGSVDEVCRYIDFLVQSSCFS